MDSSASSHESNWLAFSLSNHLFSPFHAANSSNDVNNGALNCASSPKLEDFLGCGANGSPTAVVAGDASSSAHHHQQPLLLNHTDVYESELKSIAASFLRGYSAEQTETQKQLAVVSPREPPAKKAVETFGQRTSIFRGVTRHRWTGRYEAHLWDNTCRREGQSRKGRQVYLGGYDKEDKAARAYDLAALKYWGPTTTTNFPVCNYEKELEEMKHMTRQEFVASLRRKSSGFSRGASIYRGVTRHHQHGRWQARIGRVAGNKDLYLGTFSTQEEAAEAYDIAAIKFRGLNAVTNFDISRYDVKSIATSNLPVGGMTNKSTTKSSSESLSENITTNKSPDDGGRDHSPATSVSFPSPTSTATVTFGGGTSDFWSSLGYHNTSSLNSCAKAVPVLFQNPNPAQFSLELPTSNSNIDGYFRPTASATTSGGYFEMGDSNINGTTATAPSTTVTRIALGSTNGTNTNAYESTNFGNWINSPNLHSFQPAKPNLSVFQTPIFGME